MHKIGGVQILLLLSLSLSLSLPPSLSSHLPLQLWWCQSEGLWSGSRACNTLRKLHNKKFGKFHKVAYLIWQRSAKSLS